MSGTINGLMLVPGENVGSTGQHLLNHTDFLSAKHAASMPGHILMVVMPASSGENSPSSELRPSCDDCVRANIDCIRQLAQTNEVTLRE